MYTYICIYICIIALLSITVDGINPAPVDRWFIPLFIGFQPSKVVQDFFHRILIIVNTIIIIILPYIYIYYVYVYIYIYGNYYCFSCISVIITMLYHTL